MSCAADGSAEVGLCQRHHPVRPPLLLGLAEVLTENGKHPDLQANTGRLRIRAAGRAYIDEVILSGVVGSGQNKCKFIREDQKSILRIKE